MNDVYSSLCPILSQTQNPFLSLNVLRFAKIRLSNYSNALCFFLKRIKFEYNRPFKVLESSRMAARGMKFDGIRTPPLKIFCTKKFQNFSEALTFILII